MNYKTHILGGVTAGLLVANYVLKTPTIETTILVSGAVVGSLIPDIDHRGSYISKRLKGVSSITSSIFKHRGKATHSLSIPSLILFITYLLTVSYVSNVILYKYLFFGVGSGIISHVLLDSLTTHGVPLLYPIYKKNISFTNFSGGGLLEKVVFITLLLILAFIITKKRAFSY